MVRRLLFVVLMLLAVPAQAEPLTLEAAVQRAVEVSPSVRLQSLSTAAAEARWLADPRAGSPSVRVGVRDIYTGVVLPNVNVPAPEISAALRFPLPRPWELAIAAEESRATTAREDAQLAGRRQEVAQAVTSRFLLLPLLRDTASQAEAMELVWIEALALVEARRAEGLATALDWLRVEEERRDAHRDRSTELSAVVAVEAELRLLLDWAPEQALELEEVDLRSRVVAPLPELGEDVSPAVAAAEAEVDRAAAGLSRRKSRAAPWFDWVQAGVVAGPERAPNVEVVTAVDIPIYQWSASRTRAADAELSRAQVRLDDEKARAADDRAAQLRRLDAASSQYAVAQQHLSAVAEQVDPLLELADPLLKLELRARRMQAELRERRALADLVQVRLRVEAN